MVLNRQGGTEDISSVAVLVTGATGFIGTHLVRALLESHFKVKVYSRQLYDADNEFGLTSQDWITGELSETEKLVNACVGVDAVFHLAGIADSNNYVLDDVFKVNLDGTKNVFSAAALTNVPKFIYFSSILAVSSDASPYVKSKIAAEEFLQSYENTSNQTETVILRPASVYGPGMGGSVRTLARLALSGFVPSLPSLKRSFRMVSVRDLCQASISFIEADCKGQRLQRYTMTDGEEYTLNRIESAIYHAIEREKPLWRLPVFIVYIVALIAYLANITGIKKNGFGMGLYRHLARHWDDELSDTGNLKFLATTNLEAEMPFIIADLDRE